VTYVAPNNSAPPSSASPDASGEPALSDLPSFSLTFSPIHVFLPVMEVTGELAIGDHIGLAAIVGGGAITVERGGSEETFDVFELGAQFRYYPVGDFDHGMQVGFETLFVHVSGEFEDEGITGTGSGLSVGPFIGYKYILPFGLTFDVQAGIAVDGIAARASNDVGSEEANEVHVSPLLNLNVGWSF
jgi:hypothetical protein